MTQSKLRVMLAAGAAVSVLVVAWSAAPALAHGGDGESDPVNLVEQALAIIVNTPDAVGEAVERVEEALEIESAEPTGDLDLEALARSLDALEAGDLHDAEDALIEALLSDPHPDDAVPDPPDTPDDGEGDGGGAGVTDEDPGEGAGEQPGAEEPPMTDPAEPTTDEPAHGLTSRIEGGLSSPDGSDLVVLGSAVLLAGGGVALWRRNGGSE